MTNLSPYLEQLKDLLAMDSNKADMDNSAMKKPNLILLSGICGAGKNSVCSILFGKRYDYAYNYTVNIGEFQLQYFSFDLMHSFRNATLSDKITNKPCDQVASLIHIIDVSKTDIDYMNQIDFMKKVISNYREFSLNCTINILLHKTDQVLQKDLPQVLASYKLTILSLLNKPELSKVNFYSTSIHESTLFSSMSKIFSSLLQNQKSITQLLKNYCIQSEFQEVALLEKNTFLLIAHSAEDNEKAITKYENLSYSLKRFRLPCQDKSNDIKSVSFNQSHSTKIELVYFRNYILIAEGTHHFNHNKLVEYLRDQIKI